MGFLSWLGGIGSSLIEGIAGTSANQSMQEDAQRWQEQMYDKQKEFWYDQQEYNSPAKQVERLGEAGINPQLALGNIQSGQMGSSPSVGSPSALSAGKFGDITGNMLNIIRGKNENKLAKAEENLLNQDANLKQIDGMSRAMKNVAEIGEIISRTDKQRGERILKEVEAWSTGLKTISTLQTEATQRSKMESEIELNVSQKAMNDEYLKVLPQRLKLEITALSSDISLKVAQGELTLSQAKTEWQKEVHEMLRAQGQELNNKLLEQTFDNLVAKSYGDVYRGFKPFDTGYMWIMNGINRISK